MIRVQKLDKARPSRLQVERFLSENPKPEDYEVHEWAEAHGWNKHGVEEMIYAILGSFIGKGRSQTAKTSPDPEQLKRGIEVEAEHTDDPKLAEKIARDHLAEIPDYYTRLDRMESAAKSLRELESLEKGKALPVGTIREWKGKKYRKGDTGWVRVKSGKGAAKGEPEGDAQAGEPQMDKGEKTVLENRVMRAWSAEDSASNDYIGLDVDTLNKITGKLKPGASDEQVKAAVKAVRTGGRDSDAAPKTGGKLGDATYEKLKSDIKNLPDSEDKSNLDAMLERLKKQASTSSSQSISDSVKDIAGGIKEAAGKGEAAVKGAAKTVEATSEGGGVAGAAEASKQAGAAVKKSDKGAAKGEKAPTEVSDHMGNVVKVPEGTSMKPAKVKDLDREFWGFDMTFPSGKAGYALVDKKTGMLVVRELGGRQKAINALGKIVEKQGADKVSKRIDELPGEYEAGKKAQAERDAAQAKRDADDKARMEKELAAEREKHESGKRAEKKRGGSAQERYDQAKADADPESIKDILDANGYRVTAEGKVEAEYYDHSSRTGGWKEVPEAALRSELDPDDLKAIQTHIEAKKNLSKLRDAAMEAEGQGKLFKARKFMNEWKLTLNAKRNIGLGTTTPDAELEVAETPAKFLETEDMSKAIEELRKEDTVVWLNKGRGLPPGTIRDWKGKKYKKVAAGKWEPVKEGKPAAGGGSKYNARPILNKLKELGVKDPQINLDTIKGWKTNHGQIDLGYKDPDTKRLHYLSTTAQSKTVKEAVEKYVKNYGVSSGERHESDAKPAGDDGLSAEAEGILESMEGDSSGTVKGPDGEWWSVKKHTDGSGKVSVERGGESQGEFSSIDAAGTFVAKKFREAKAKKSQELPDDLAKSIKREERYWQLNRGGALPIGTQRSRAGVSYRKEAADQWVRI